MHNCIYRGKNIYSLTLIFAYNRPKLYANCINL
nr:MAG TPA: hypothetical protein [Crassvirales sp.]